MSYASEAVPHRTALTRCAIGGARDPGPESFRREGLSRAATRGGHPPVGGLGTQLGSPGRLGRGSGVLAAGLAVTLGGRHGRVSREPEGRPRRLPRWWRRYRPARLATPRARRGAFPARGGRSCSGVAVVAASAGTAERGQRGVTPNLETRIGMVLLPGADTGLPAATTEPRRQQRPSDRPIGLVTTK